MNIALLIIVLGVLLALGLGLAARLGHDMRLESWTVGNRGFGAVLVFILLAGEIYTTFTFLGAAGWAYGLGAPAFYILAYGAIAYALSYFMLPSVWRFARANNLVSQPDFFATKYGSPGLGVLVAIVGIVALIPYLVLQFTGLAVIVQAASFGAVPKSVSVLLGAVVVSAYVVASGIRGSAWTSFVKDGLIIVIAIFLGLYLPYHYQGGLGAMFAAIDHAKPGFLSFAASGHSVTWFVSTVILTALGFFMWPHSFAACFSARNENVFRKNAIILPLYQLVLLFIFFVGFAAVLVVPGLKGAATNMALLKLVIATFPPWVVGIVGATGVLTALVPGSLILVTASTLLARNLVAALVPNTAEPEREVRLAKMLVPVVALVGAYFAISGNDTIVSLLLMGYAFVTQLFPAMILSLSPRNPLTRQGAIVGILVGVAAVVYFTMTGMTVAKLWPEGPEVLRDINIGTVSLILNLIAALIVSAATAVAERRPALSRRSG
jgi:SSS family solute:Na+ symporter